MAPSPRLSQTVKSIGDIIGDGTNDGFGLKTVASVAEGVFGCYLFRVDDSHTKYFFIEQ